MTSLNDQLLAGERIVYRTRPHWILFGGPLLVALAGLILGVTLQLTVNDLRYQYAGWYAGAAPAGRGPPHRHTARRSATSAPISPSPTSGCWRGWASSNRQSLETLLSKIEGIGVEQDVWGRILGFGTITITGTGGTRESIAGIPRPLEFRRAGPEPDRGPRRAAAGGSPPPRSPAGGRGRASSGTAPGARSGSSPGRASASTAAGR